MQRLEADRDREREIADRLTAALARMAQGVAPPATAPMESRPALPSPLVGPLFGELIQPFLDAKSRHWKPGTMHQAKATLRLWVELMGDQPVAAVTGRDAARFLDLLRRLPASHGKATRGKGDALTALRAIERADGQKGAPVPRLSEKTVKRHASALSQFWAWMKPQEYVASNVFEGFRFAGTKASRSKRLDWSDDDLLRLLGTPWRIASPPTEAYAWMTLLAIYTGMRAEEIARLRPADVRIVDGVTVLMIQEQDGWSPKTEAGERAVPSIRACKRSASSISSSAGAAPALLGSSRGWNRAGRTAS